MPSTRNLFKAKSERRTKGNGARGLLSRAMSSRDRIQESRTATPSEDVDSNELTSPTTSRQSVMDAFRWSIMPSKDIAPSGVYHSSDDEDEDDDSVKNSNDVKADSTATPSRMTSLDRAISARSGLVLSSPEPTDSVMILGGGGGLNPISENSNKEELEASETSESNSKKKKTGKKSRKFLRSKDLKLNDFSEELASSTSFQPNPMGGASLEDIEEDGKSHDGSIFIEDKSLDGSVFIEDEEKTQESKDEMKKSEKKSKKSKKGSSMDKSSSHSQKKKKKIRSKSPVRIDFAGQVTPNSDNKPRTKRGMSPKRRIVEDDEEKDDKDKSKASPNKVDIVQRTAAAEKALGKHIEKSENLKSDRVSFSSKLRVSFLSDHTSTSFGYEDASSPSKHPSLEEEKQRVSVLLDELEDYERKLSQEHSVLELERESLEFELDKQMAENQQLEQSVHEMQSKIEELETALQSQQEEEALRIENEMLRQRLERQEAALMNMNLSYSKESVDGLDDLSSPVSNDASESSPQKPSAKHQGDLLQANAKVAEKDAQLLKQAKEIQALKREIEDYQDENGTRKMKSYIDGLEQEKKYFISEIERLKKQRTSFGFGRNSASNHSAMSSISGFSNDDSSSFVSLAGEGGGGGGDNKVVAQQPPQMQQRASTSTWKGLSSRLFGGGPRPVVQKPPVSDADKMLDELTRDL